MNLCLHNSFNDYLDASIWRKPKKAENLQTPRIRNKSNMSKDTEKHVKYFGNGCTSPF